MADSKWSNNTIFPPITVTGVEFFPGLSSGSNFKASLSTSIVPYLNTAITLGSSSQVTGLNATLNSKLTNTNNLSDVSSASTSATNLGLGTTSNVTFNSLTLTTPLAAPNINFNTTNLRNSSGALNTIQDINSSASPTFSNLFLTSDLSLSGSLPSINYTNNTAITGSFLSKNTIRGLDSLSRTNTYAEINTIIGSNTSDQGQIEFLVSESLNNLIRYIFVDGTTQNVTFERGVKITGLSANSVVVTNSSNQLITSSPLSASYINYNTQNLKSFIGQLDTIQNIDLTSSPTFFGLNLETSDTFNGGSSGIITFNDGNGVTFSQINSVNVDESLLSGYLSFSTNQNSTLTEYARLDGSTQKIYLYKTVNLPTLSANQFVATDGSNNLISTSVPPGTVSYGSYTPTIGDGTNNFTTSTALGKYAFIGNLYFVSIRLVWTSKGSASGTQPVLISLPFTVGSSNVVTCASIGYYSVTSSTNSINVDALTGQSSLSVWSSSAGFLSQLLVISASGSGEIRLNVTFWNI